MIYKYQVIKPDGEGTTIDYYIRKVCQYIVESDPEEFKQKVLNLYPTDNISTYIEDRVNESVQVFEVNEENEKRALGRLQNKILLQFIETVEELNEFRNTNFSTLKSLTINVKYIN